MMGQTTNNSVNDTKRAIYSVVLLLHSPHTHTHTSTEKTAAAAVVQSEWGIERLFFFFLTQEIALCNARAQNLHTHTQATQHTKNVVLENTLLAAFVSDTIYEVTEELLVVKNKNMAAFLMNKFQ